jgi:hypothetical protein
MTAVTDEDSSQEVSLNTLWSLIAKGLKRDTRAEEAHEALGLLGEGG